MKIDIITIFPGMFEPVLNESITKRAQEKGKVEIRAHNLRDYTHDRHRTVDDRPFGGGSGMVLKPEPVFEAIAALKKKANKGKKALKTVVALMTPQGQTLSQNTCRKLARIKHLILICGRYEGVDERIREACDMEISIGDYVLTGGELPAMVLVDSVVRLIPGVLGDKNSLNFESFEGNLLEYPQYTRPAVFKGMKVPAVLLGGDHQKIEEWRRQQAIQRTRRRRPDLILKDKERKQHER
ncbi:MAG: tRNA (guanosine(37)-N1)-methyltransferase TrmD [Deltaproteobacteria bacterium]